MTTIALRVRPGKTLNLDDSKYLSDKISQWAKGVLDLDAVLKFLNKTSLDRRHLASGVMQKGQLIKSAASRHDDNAEYPFDQQAGKTALGQLILLLENLRTRTAAVSSIWEENPPNDPDWIINISKHLSDRAVYLLLITRPEPAAIRSKAMNILPSIAQSVTNERKEVILSMAKKHRKITRLYAATGWQECRALATETERSELLGLDLGI
ncbi:hypothetical protein [Pseudomonas sp. Leaf58]|uniref:hypothetical protein n=1 Tax=Pseudomonas sp. Leaf58 TaxID=1736226 RepID=UPI0006F4452B|nr:hypothetical protein [Pseudomonas sp. Leaf58]KQN62120.1 hypothetical protein ASF02_08035 [Pseudomonas sp. Leaf58]